MTTWGTTGVAGLGFRREGTSREGPRCPGQLLGTLDSFLHLRGRRVISRAQGTATRSQSRMGRGKPGWHERQGLVNALTLVYKPLLKQKFIQEGIGNMVKCEEGKKKTKPC